MNTIGVSRVFFTGLLVMLAACTGGTTPPSPTPHLGLNPTITGTVPNYNFGAKPLTIKANVFALDAGSIAASGAFTLTLPASGVPEFNLVPNCTSGSITTLPVAAKGAMVSSTVTQSQEIPFPAALGQTWNEYSRMFVAQDVVLNGSCRFLINVDGTTNSETYNNLILKAGWNEITTKNTRNNPNNLGESDKVTTLGIPANQPWRLTSSEIF